MPLRKLRYYLSSILLSLVPGCLYRAAFSLSCRYLLDEQDTAVLDRVAYYNRCNKAFTLDDAQSETIGNFKPGQSRAYYYDLMRYLRCFPAQCRFQAIFGDVSWIPKSPALVKSRPIAGDNQNAVLMKLNCIRHYRFVKDPYAWQQKYDAVVWRGAGYKGNRLQMLARHTDNPACDIGMTKPLTDDGFNKPFMSIREQLKYKFILCPEGNDVATNLKWVLSSNSLCLMPAPRYETWFMEGALQAGVHYVQLNDDYSDLNEKIDYYLQHPQAAQTIVANANAHVAQFRDRRREMLISLMVLDKYLQACNTDQTLSAEHPSAAAYHLINE